MTAAGKDEAQPDGGIANPSLYDELARPIEDPKEVQARLDAFFRDVEEARVRHRIPDFVIAASVYTVDDDCDDGPKIRIHGCVAQRGMGYVAPILGFYAYEKFTLPMLLGTENAFMTKAIEHVTALYGDMLDPCDVDSEG